MYPRLEVAVHGVYQLLDLEGKRDPLPTDARGYISVALDLARKNPTRSFRVVWQFHDPELGPMIAVTTWVRGLFEGNQLGKPYRNRNGLWMQTKLYAQEEGERELQDTSSAKPIEPTVQPTASPSL